MKLDRGRGKESTERERERERETDMRYREGKTAPFPLPLFSRCESPEQQSGTAQNRSIRSGQGRARKGGRRGEERWRNYLSPDAAVSAALCSAVLLRTSGEQEMNGWREEINNSSMVRGSDM